MAASLRREVRSSALVSWRLTYRLDGEKEARPMKALYNVSFPTHPEYNAEYELSLEKSGSFNYGNGTCVVIKRDGKMVEAIDTRYENMTDFYLWCDSYMERKFDRSYNPVIVRI